MSDWTKCADKLPSTSRPCWVRRQGFGWLGSEFKTVLVERYSTSWSSCFDTIRSDDQWRYADDDGPSIDALRVRLLSELADVDRKRRIIQDAGKQDSGPDKPKPRD